MLHEVPMTSSAVGTAAHAELTATAAKHSGLADAHMKNLQWRTEKPSLRMLRLSTRSLFL